MMTQPSREELLDPDAVALDAAQQIEALPSDLHPSQRTARIQLLVMEAMRASSAQALPLQSDDELAHEIHLVAGCQVGSERCKNIIKWYRGKVAALPASSAPPTTVSSTHRCRNYPDVICPSMECQFECQVGKAALSSKLREGEK